MVYKVDTMQSVEIDTPTWKHTQFNEEENEAMLRCEVDLIDKTHKVAHIREFISKQRASRMYKSMVVPREMQKGDLMLKQVVVPARLEKL